APEVFPTGVGLAVVLQVQADEELGVPAILGRDALDDRVDRLEVGGRLAAGERVADQPADRDRLRGLVLVRRADRGEDRVAADAVAQLVGEERDVDAQRGRGLRVEGQVQGGQGLRRRAGRPVVIPHYLRGGQVGA